MCGAIRSPLETAIALSTLIEAQKKGLAGEILLSTWKGEIENSGLSQNWMNENSIVCIETDPPSGIDFGRGNNRVQKLLLARGLDFFEPDEVVCRVRTDRVSHLLIDTLNHAQSYDAVSSKKSPTYASKPISVLHYSLTEILNVCDLVMISDVRTLRLLTVQTDLGFQSEARPVRAEAFWFYPMLSQSKQVSDMLTKTNSILQSKQICKELDQNKILKTLNASKFRDYINTLRENFNLIKSYSKPKNKLKNKGLVLTKNDLKSYYEEPVNEFLKIDDMNDTTVQNIFNELDTDAVIDGFQKLTSGLLSSYRAEKHAASFDKALSIGSLRNTFPVAAYNLTQEMKTGDRNNLTFDALLEDVGKYKAQVVLQKLVEDRTTIPSINKLIRTRGKYQMGAISDLAKQIINGERNDDIDVELVARILENSNGDDATSLAKKLRQLGD
jgi:hypothetical protein